MGKAAPVKASAPLDKAAASFKAPPDLIFTAAGACIVVGEVLPHGSAIMGRVCAGRPGKLDPINQTWVAVEGPFELAVKQLDVLCVRAHRSKPSLGWSYVKEDPRVEIEVMRRIVDAGGHPHVLGGRDVIGEREARGGQRAVPSPTSFSGRPVLQRMNATSRSSSTSATAAT